MTVSLPEVRPGLHPIFVLFPEGESGGGMHTKWWGEWEAGSLDYLPPSPTPCTEPWGPDMGMVPSLPF